MFRLRAFAPFALLGAASLLPACGSSDGGGDGTVDNTCRNISGTVMANGLEIRRPENDAAACRSIPQTEDPEKSSCEMKPEPDLSCFKVPGTGGPPAQVTLRGCVEVFGLAASLDFQRVTIFQETLNGMPVDPGYDVGAQRGTGADTTPAAVIGAVETVRVAEDVCPDEYQYTVEGVPTETDLIVRVTHDDERFVDTYQYNYRLSNDRVTDATGMPVTDRSNCTPATCFVEEVVNTIELGTFITIPRTAGVGTIPGESNLFDGVGEGHIAGEVQDCTSEDTIQNAVISVDTRVRKLAYFNIGFPPDRDDLEDPTPESTRTRTNADGLYAAIGVETETGGKAVTIGSAITRSVCGADGVCMCNEDGTTNPAYTAADAMEGETTVLGTRQVFVFPDSITIMTFDRTFYEAQ